MAGIKRKLGTISRCEVKDVWDQETDFSDWLAKPDNLQGMCDALGLDTFDAVERESNVGPYRADIVGTMPDGSHVIIENQWGQTNHDHLGKVITYASGKNASVIVWIAERYDDEHSSAIEWLNNISNGTSFFLVMIELIRIGDSDPAPLFNVIQRPNNYIQMQNVPQTDADRIRYDFWRGFLDYASRSEALKRTLQGVDTRNLMSYNYYTFSRGCNGFEIHVIISLKKQTKQAFSIRIWIPDNKSLYERFYESRGNIENELGQELSWNNPEAKKSSSITYAHIIKSNESDESCYRWCEEMAPRMREIFNRYAEGE